MDTDKILNRIKEKMERYDYMQRKAEEDKDNIGAWIYAGAYEALDNLRVEIVHEKF